MDPENSDDEQQGGPEQSFFEESAELTEIVQRVVDSDGQEASKVYDRYKAIVRIPLQVLGYCHCGW